MISLQGKTVVITGGTRGLGLRIASTFDSAGAIVFVGARNPCERLEAQAPGAVFVETDVRRYDSMFSLVKKAVESTGKLDVMINNAGVSIWRRLENIDEEFWHHIVDTNLKGCFWGCKAAAEQMKAGGAIVNIGSLAGKRGSKNNSVYCASKFGVVGLTQALAKELGPRQIRVNSVCPVYIKTKELIHNLCGDHPDIGGMQPEDFLETFGKQNAALERIPNRSEVANMCIFLASDLASAITGQNINVDCGVFPQ